jgi:uncharacterized protein (DUF934 family)
MQIRFIDRAADAWQLGAEDAPVAPAPHRLVSLAQWQAVRATWPHGLPVGVSVPNTEDIEALAPDLPRLALVALQFPKWVDGRAYSQAHVLRQRLRFTGEIRATGDVVVDMMLQLVRSGFDAVVLREGQRRSSAERALGFFPAFYQGDALEPRPLFGRRAA